MVIHGLLNPPYIRCLRHYNLKPATVHDRRTTKRTIHIVYGFFVIKKKTKRKKKKKKTAKKNLMFFFIFKHK